MVGLAAAAFSVALFVIEYTVEASVFAILAVVFLYLAVAAFAGWWPLASPADPQSD